MQEVVKLVIKPATKRLGVGYALLINQDKPLKAKVMVSVSTLHITILIYICLFFNSHSDIFLHYPSCYLPLHPRLFLIACMGRKDWAVH